jgi:integrase
MGVKVKQWKGAWWIFINHDKQRKSTRVGIGDSGKRAAIEAARQIQARLALGQWPFGEEQRKNVPTLREYASDWLTHYVAVATKPRTQELYASMLQRHVYPVLGDKRLDEIEREDIRRLLAEKAESRYEAKKHVGKNRAEKVYAVEQRKYKRSTLRNILAPLREMFNQAVQDGKIPQNPAIGFGKMLSKMKDADDTGKRVQIFTEAELKHLLSTAERAFPYDADIVTTLAWTGMRGGEVFGLQWGDIDFKNGFIEVRRTVGYRKGQLWAGSPKSGKARRVDIPRNLGERLRTRLDRAREYAALNERAFAPWVFPNLQGNPMDASHFNARLWQPLMRATEVRYLPPHSLRHTYASLLLMRGENPLYVKEQLGHSSIQVTIDRYGHLIPGIHRGAVDAFSEATNATPAQPRNGIVVVADVDDRNMIEITRS